MKSYAPTFLLKFFLPRTIDTYLISFFYLKRYFLPKFKSVVTILFSKYFLESNFFISDINLISYKRPGVRSILKGFCHRDSAIEICFKKKLFHFEYLYLHFLWQNPFKEYKQKNSQFAFLFDVDDD